MSKKTKMTEFADETYQISVTGRNVHVTDSMKDYAIEKVGKIERFTDRIIDIHVIMDIQKLEHRCDIVLRANHIKIKSHAVSQDMYASIDESVKKLEHQLTKYMDKLHKHQQKPKAWPEMQVDVITAPNEEDFLAEINEQIEEENDKLLQQMYKPHMVVKQKTKPLKHLTMDEAVMKMELSQDNFLLFINEKTERLMVIYRRHDGNYGILTPEL